MSSTLRRAGQCVEDSAAPETRPTPRAVGCSLCRNIGVVSSFFAATKRAAGNNLTAYAFSYFCQFLYSSCFFWEGVLLVGRFMHCIRFGFDLFFLDSLFLSRFLPVVSDFISSQCLMLRPVDPSALSSVMLPPACRPRRGLSPGVSHGLAFRQHLLFYISLTGSPLPLHGFSEVLPWLCWGVWLWDRPMQWARYWGQAELTRGQTPPPGLPSLMFLPLASSPCSRPFPGQLFYDLGASWTWPPCPACSLSILPALSSQGYAPPPGGVRSPSAFWIPSPSDIFPPLYLPRSWPLASEHSVLPCICPHPHAHFLCFLTGTWDWLPPSLFLPHTPQPICKVTAP